MVMETGTEKKSEPVKRGDWRQERAASFWFLVVASTEGTMESHRVYRIVLFSTATGTYAAQLMVHIHRQSARGKERNGEFQRPSVVRIVQRRYSCLILASPFGKRPECPVPGSRNGMSTVSGGR